MNGAIMRFATREPTVCAVCRRRAVWVGYAPLTGTLRPLTPPVWLCGETECSIAARAAYVMAKDEFDQLELNALHEAGADAAGYLEECGTTDLAGLDEVQWHEFLRRVTRGFELGLKTKILNHEPPF